MLKRSILILFLLCAVLSAQSQISLTAPAPSNVSNVSTTGGTSGSNTFYYWVIAVYPVGKVMPNGPAIAIAKATPTGGSPISVSWTTPAGATSVDVLKTTTSAVPTGTCTCALAMANTSGSVSDTGGALSSYTVTSIGGASAQMVLDNGSQSAPFIPVTIQSSTGTTVYRLGYIQPTATVGDCAQITSLPGVLSSTPCAGATTPGGSNGQIEYNNAGAFGGFTASGDATINTSTGAVANLKVNGVAYPASPSTHQSPVVTASNTATYKTIPDCPDQNGNHLNFTQSGDDYSCGTSSSSGGSVTPAGYSPNQTLQGCGVEYITLLQFQVGACTYTIAGVTYTSPITPETLAAADPTNPRIDVIGVDYTGAVFVTTGTPAASPAQPTIDPATQLGLAFVLVAANATTPSNTAIRDIYEENTEWTSAVTANFNAASTNNPYRGTKDIEATTAVLTNSVTLTKPAAGTETLTNWNTLTFYIRSKAAWPTGTGASAARFLNIFWLSGATQVGVPVVLRDGQFGFTSSNTSTYQQISIPVSLFGTGGSSVTSVKFQVDGKGGSTSIGFYLDAITLQSGSGIITLPQTLMNFKGTWNSSAAYNVNDTVVSGGIGYVALVANTNVAVGTAATWAPLAPAATTQVHAVNFFFNGGGSTIATGDSGFYPGTGALTGTINRVDISGGGTAGAACSITVDIWKRNAAIPTSGQKISASAPATLSSANLAQSGSLTGWTTSVTANDVWGASVATITGCITALVQVWFQ